MQKGCQVIGRGEVERGEKKIDREAQPELGVCIWACINQPLESSGCSR